MFENCIEYDYVVPRTTDLKLELGHLGGLENNLVYRLSEGRLTVGGRGEPTSKIDEFQLYSSNDMGLC